MDSRPASLPFTVLLGVLFALTALGTDAWLPALPVAALLGERMGWHHALGVAFIVLGLYLTTAARPAS